MADMNITLDEANAWIAKVEAEMDEVQEVLKKAIECVAEYQESEDTIHKELNIAVKSYKSAWDHLGQAYKDAFKGLRAVFKSQIEAVQEAIEMVKKESKKAKC